MCKQILYFAKTIFPIIKDKRRLRMLFNRIFESCYGIIINMIEILDDIIPDHSITIDFHLKPFEI